MRLKIMGLLWLLGMSACQRPTAEDKRAREPVSVKTHILSESKEILEGRSGPVIPIEHGSFALQLNKRMLYVDPMGNSFVYEDLPPADLILVTHSHPDYLVPSAIQALVKEETQIIVPQAIHKVLPEDLKSKAFVIKPGKDSVFYDMNIKIVERIETDDNGRKISENNGALIENERHRIFVSGDNNHFRELPDIKDIDIALIQMNVRDSLSFEDTVNGILRIHPQTVFPYYYQGPFSYSYVAQLKGAVQKSDPNIEVKILDWYKTTEEAPGPTP